MIFVTCLGAIYHLRNNQNTMWQKCCNLIGRFCNTELPSYYSHYSFHIWYTWSVPSEELIDNPDNIMWPNAAIWLVDFVTWITKLLLPIQLSYLVHLINTKWRIELTFQLTSCDQMLRSDWSISVTWITKLLLPLQHPYLVHSDQYQV